MTSLSRKAMEARSWQFFALGSDCVLQLFAADAAAADRAATEAMNEIGRIEARYSRYKADSELSRINAVAMTGGTVEIDAETAGLIDYAYACYLKSDGLFDISSGLLRKAWNLSLPQLPAYKVIDELLPRVGLDKVGWDKPRLTFKMPGMELDFGGIGKEYAADRAATVCKAMGICHGLVDLGGDIRLIGPRPDGPWRVGIRHPRDSSTAMATVELVSGAIATSGDYERFIEADGRRYCHILNPRTGWPVSSLRSVSIISQECLIAGTLATTALLRGRAGAAWLRSLGVPYLIMDDDGRLDGVAPFQTKV